MYSLTLKPLRSRTKFPTLTLDWELSSKIEVICVFVFKDLVGRCKSNSYLIKKWILSQTSDESCTWLWLQQLGNSRLKYLYHIKNVSNYLIKMATRLKTVDFFYNMNHVWKINKNLKHNLKLWSIHTQKKQSHIINDIYKSCKVS